MIPFMPFQPQVPLPVQYQLSIQHKN